MTKTPKTISQIRIKTVSVEYIENGTFCGGEDQTSAAGIKRGEICVVLRKKDYERLRKMANEQQEARP
jgi:hypothetical protein